MKSPLNILGGSGGGRSEANKQECINLYLSTDQGKSPQGTYLPTPGSKLQKIVDAGKPVRGIHSARGVLYAVVGDGFYAYADINPVLRGTIGTSTGPVTIVDNGEGNQVAICDGDSLYVWEGTTIENVRKARTMTYQNRYLVISELNQSIIRWNEAGGNFKNWDETDFIAADAMPDGVLKVYSDHNEIWAFGEFTTEVFYQTNADPLFAPLPNGTLTTGIGAIDSVASVDNTIYWLDNSKMIRQAQGYTPVIISDEVINYKISQLDRTDDAIGMTYVAEGSTFYVITFPTADKTFVYDVKLGLWHQWSTGLAEGRHFSNSMTFYSQKYWHGGFEDGSLYTLEMGFYYDNADVIRRVRTPRTLKSQNGNFISHNAIELEVADAEHGPYPFPPQDPVLTISDEPPTLDPPAGRVTDLGAKTWGENGIYKYFESIGDWEEVKFNIKADTNEDPVNFFVLLVGGEYNTYNNLVVKMYKEGSAYYVSSSFDGIRDISEIKVSPDSFYAIDIFNTPTGPKITINSEASLDLQPYPGWPSQDGGDIAIGSGFIDKSKAISGGDFHSVGLKDDGTLFGAGNNTQGQLNFGAWTNVKSISCSAYQTVALLNDGTCVGVGLNSSGQLNIGSWTDVIDISAGRTHTVGIKSDGTTYAAGSNAYGQIDIGSWFGMTAIETSYRHTVGLRDNGKCFATGENTSGQTDVGDWENVRQIACGWGHTVGLLEDGTCIATGSNIYGQIDVSSWYDITEIRCGNNHTVGKRIDGTCLAVGINNNQEIEVGSFSDIAKIGCGSSNSLGLKFDGLPIGVGDNTFNQLDFTGWSDLYTSLQYQPIIKKVEVFEEPPDPVEPPQPDGELSMQYSNDDGKTWNTLKSRSLKIGDKFVNRLKWRGLGRARNRLYRFVTESPVAIELINAWSYFKENTR